MREAQSRFPRWRMTGARLWTGAAAAALIAASGWLKSDSVEYLAVLVVATLASLAAFVTIRGAQRGWAAVCDAALIAVGLIAIQAQSQLRSIDRNWPGWQHAHAVSGGRALRDSLDAAVTHTWATALNAIRQSSDTSRLKAFESLKRLIPAGYERGVVLFRYDSAFAWAGHIQVAVDDAPLGLDVYNSSVYLELRATVQSGDLRATAVSLIDAVPPGDRLTTSLVAEVARESDLAGFVLSDTASGPLDADVLPYAVNRVRLFDIRPLSKERPAVEEDIRERARLFAGLSLGIALFAFVLAAWRSTREMWLRLSALGIVLLAIALIPLNQFSARTRLFDPATYYAQIGGPLTANAGALGISSAIALLGVIAIIRRRRRKVSFALALATVAVVVIVGPFLLGNLSRGIAAPTGGVDWALWLIWEIPIFLAAVTVLLTGTAAGAIIVGRGRGLHPAVAPTVAAAAGIIAPIVWTPQAEWPGWYTILWIVAIGAVVLSRQTRFMILAASTVAAFGAATLVWRSTVVGRMELAVHDLSGLNAGDPNTLPHLRHFALGLAQDSAPQTRQALLEEYVRSELEAAGHPVELSSWPTDEGPNAVLQTARFPGPPIRGIVAEARRTGVTIIDTVQTDSATVLVMAVPAQSGGVTAVVVAPNSQLFAPDSVVRLYGLNVGQGTEPPYTIQLRRSEPASATEAGPRWRLEDDKLHGDWVVRTGTGAALMHIEVDLRPLDALVERGTLIVLIDLAIVGVLWLVGVAADGGAGRWLRARQRSWAGSFRARLSLALFGFFVIPAAAFAIWSYQQVVNDTRLSRRAQMSETLRSVSVVSPVSSHWMTEQSTLVRAPLLLYEGSELQQASDTLLEAFAPFGRFLDPAVEILISEDEGIVTTPEALGSASVLVGFRPLDRYGFARAVIAAPITADDYMLGRRRRDLGVLVLVTTVLGAIAAFWLSGIAARQLARPIGTLRTAALALAAGEPLPRLETAPTAEFRPVFTAFRRMAADLSASRSDLEEAQRRTAAVLRNVASGVIAVSPGGAVVLANPRASTILDAPLAPGSPFADAAPNQLVVPVARFLSNDAEEEAFEVEAGLQQLRGRITRLERGGAVVTIDDVTELARAQRVLAWGEMARQVAHEIKNPLTPIRLGVQHLKRARADNRVDFDRILDQNVTRILAEIDRLDEIARAFSKYGSGPEDRRSPEPTDIAAVVRDTVGLEQMGVEDGVHWEIRGVDAPLIALANAPELKEVLLNLLENARLAHPTTVAVEVARVGGDGVTPATWVRVTVRDDGRGIPAAILPRIFEPHFSTRTSGSGLGLAISRQLIDGWGGEIDVTSAVGEGTTVSLRLLAPSPEPS